MLKIFLTGGGGFIGRNIVEGLGRDYAIDAPRSRELDLRDETRVKEWFAERRYDLVIHCATKPGHRNAPDPTGLYAANTAMFRNLQRERGKYGRLIYVGSGSEYDSRHYLPKMREEYFGVHVPEDEGGRSKYEIAKSVEENQGMLNLRLFGVYGKYEDYAIRFISNAICRTIFDLPVRVNQNKLFDYLYIDDFLEILRHFIENEWAHKTFNVTPDEAVEIKTLAEQVVSVSGKNLPVILKTQKFGLEYSGDNSRIKSVMGPKYRLRPHGEAIKELYAWYLENADSLDRAMITVDE